MLDRIPSSDHVITHLTAAGVIVVILVAMDRKDEQYAVAGF
jgi:hypothetical protein